MPICSPLTLIPTFYLAQSCGIPYPEAKMTSLPGPNAPRVLLTIDQVAQWKADLLHNKNEIARLGSENQQIERKLAAASVFLDVDSVEPAPIVANSPAASKEEQEVNKPRRKRRGDMTWADVVEAAVYEAELGLTYAEMRQIASNSELSAKFAQSDKGYHNAIGRLVRDGYIVREHGRLFTKEAHKRFMIAVDSGEASTTVPQPMAYSPMGEAILKIVSENPASFNGKGVIQKLRLDAEFNAALTPHETGAYNIISRLVRREQLVRRDDGTLVPGRNFPKDRGYALKRNEVPNGIAAGTSVAGGAATPLNESQGRLPDLD
jgi:hypothetical protein